MKLTPCFEDRHSMRIYKAVKFEENKRPDTWAVFEFVRTVNFWLNLGLYKGASAEEAINNYLVQKGFKKSTE